MRSKRIVRAADNQPFQRQLIVRTVACACTSVCRRVACSAWAMTTSIGASVPISTRDWLSCTSLAARS